MAIRNRFLNYYVVADVYGGKHRVYSFAVNVPVQTAHAKLEEILGKKIPEPLQVCYDVDADLLYVPNADDFADKYYVGMLDAAKRKIEKEVGEINDVKPLVIDPFSTLRVRSVGTFPYASKIIKNRYEHTDFRDIPVVEANLDKMPTTVATLPEKFQNKNVRGGYIGPGYGSSVEFYEGKDKETRIPLWRQETPFILINISEGASPTIADKEWVILQAYRELVADTATSDEERDLISKTTALHTIRRLLYLGWPFETICAAYLKPEMVGSFMMLLDYIEAMLVSARSLADDGYKDPTGQPYYMIIPIDPETFPLDLNSLIDESTGRIDPFTQIPMFRILDYDKETSTIIVESPLFIPPKTIKKILKPTGEVVVLRYNPDVKKIDVKSEAKSFTPYYMGTGGKRDKLGQKYNTVRALIAEDIERSGLEMPEKLTPRVAPDGKSAWSENRSMFNFRRVSDYSYAMDSIRLMCDKANIPFNDISVIVGPVQWLLNMAGVKGAFMDEKLFRANNIPIPFEIPDENISISPPVILIDTQSHKNDYANQTSTVIHEYQHYIDTTLDPDYELPTWQEETTMFGKTVRYLSHKSERNAHKEEIKNLLRMGRSVHDIIREKIQGDITLEKFPSALKFNKLIEEAIEELKQEEEQGEENEEPTE